jgi:hypothetical protein
MSSKKKVSLFFAIVIISLTIFVSTANIRNGWFHSMNETSQNITSLEGNSFHQSGSLIAEDRFTTAYFSNSSMTHYFAG